MQKCELNRKLETASVFLKKCYSNCLVNSYFRIGKVYIGYIDLFFIIIMQSIVTDNVLDVKTNCIYRIIKNIPNKKLNIFLKR